jgi:hypothetical protein
MASGRLKFIELLVLSCHTLHKQHYIIASQLSSTEIPDKKINFLNVAMMSVNKLPAVIKLITIHLGRSVSS